MKFNYSGLKKKIGIFLVMAMMVSGSFATMADAYIYNPTGSGSGGGNSAIGVDATTFSGSDICQQVNNAYAAGPSTGVKVIIPQGSYPNCASGGISAATNNKPLDLECATAGGGTIINYTATSGSAISINTNNGISNPSEIHHCKFLGSNGSTANGSTGVNVGGSNGAFSVLLDDVYVRGFGTGWNIGSNVSFFYATGGANNFNGKLINDNPSAGANGENMRVDGTILADSNNQTDGSSVANYCINIQNSGNVQWTFSNLSIDDCQLYQNQFGGTANKLNLVNIHFENPAADSIASYDFIHMLSNQAADVITMTGGDFMNDANGSGKANEFILNGGSVNLNGVTVDLNNNVTAPMTNVVTNQDATGVDKVQWAGLTNKFANTSASSAATYIYGTVPLSQTGYGDATNQGPTLVATDFPGSDIGVQANSAYASAIQAGQTGVTINIPRGKYSYSTPIVCGNAGTRCLLTGTPGGGTELDYTGSSNTPAINLNSGIQASGIDHTSGNGIYGISLYGNATSTTNPQVGVLVGNASSVYTWNSAVSGGTGTLTTASTPIMFTGDPVRITNAGGAVPTGLALNTTYYLIRVTATTFQLASSLANANANTPIATSSNGTGTNTVAMLANGTDGAVMDATNIYGFGRGLVVAGNAYHMLYENGTIRNNGQNTYVNPASNSGESIDFVNAFIVDGASNNPADCFYVDNSGSASLNYTGGSFDDCQVHILQANNVTITGTHFENPGSAAWGAYTYIAIDQNLATNLDLNGDTFFATGTVDPTSYISNGGNVTMNGVIVRKLAGSTLTNFGSVAGSGRFTWIGLNDVSGTAFTNVVSGSPYTPQGFANAAGAAWSIDNNASALFTSVRGKAVAFASLPGTPVEGMLEPVTDSTTAVWGATITGGGANHVLAYYDGTAWTVSAK